MNQYQIEQLETNSEEKRRRYLRGALITPVGIGAGRSIKNFASRKFANGRWKGTALSAGKECFKICRKSSSGRNSREQ